jgi:prevent-host-death family protein
MRKVGAFQAKAHFSELLDEVEAGEKITITRHSEPVAMIVPARGSAQRENVERRLSEISSNP